MAQVGLSVLFIEPCEARVFIEQQRKKIKEKYQRVYLVFLWIWCHAKAWLFIGCPPWQPLVEFFRDEWHEWVDKAETMV